MFVDDIVHRTVVSKQGAKDRIKRSHDVLYTCMKVDDVYDLPICAPQRLH